MLVFKIESPGSPAVGLSGPSVLQAYRLRLGQAEHVIQEAAEFMPIEVGSVLPPVQENVRNVRPAVLQSNKQGLARESRARPQLARAMSPIVSVPP